LGVLLGANIGTTSTAWLVSLKLTSFGPFFIVLGTVLSAPSNSLQNARESRVLFRVHLF
jgi:Na+/phosphate symporter